VQLRLNCGQTRYVPNGGLARRWEALSEGTYHRGVLRNGEVQKAGFYLRVLRQAAVLVTAGGGCVDGRAGSVLSSEFDEASKSIQFFEFCGVNRSGCLDLLPLVKELVRVPTKHGA